MPAIRIICPLDKVDAVRGIASGVDLDTRDGYEYDGKPVVVLVSGFVPAMKARAIARKATDHGAVAVLGGAAIEGLTKAVQKKVSTKKDAEDADVLH